VQGLKPGSKIMLIGSSAEDVLKIQSLKEDKLMRGFEEENRNFKGA